MYKFIHALSALLLATLAACASQDEKYEPDCNAFAGDRVFLSGKRFEWEKFTDQRIVDNNGNVVDAFPAYPKTGTFAVDGNRLTFKSDDGDEMEDYFTVIHHSERYLMSQEQHRSYLVEGNTETCVLKLSH